MHWINPAYVLGWVLSWLYVGLEHIVFSFESGADAASRWWSKR